MSDSSHLFVFEEVKEVKDINDDLKDYSELRAVFKASISEAVEKTAQLNQKDLDFLVLGWAYYATRPKAFVQESMKYDPKRNERLEVIFDVLQEKIAKEPLSSKFIVRQSDELSKAYWLLDKASNLRQGLKIT